MGKSAFGPCCRGRAGGVRAGRARAGDEPLAGRVGCGVLFFPGAAAELGRGRLCPRWCKATAAAREEGKKMESERAEAVA